MSTIKVNSIEPANAGSEDYFLARAWVNFNGTGTVAIRDSGNVSSLTDNGTGDFTVNFSSALTDANFCAATDTTAYSLTDSTRHAFIAGAYNTGAANKTTTTLRIQTGVSNASGKTDMAETNASAIR
jgi:hypothetical protein